MQIMKLHQLFFKIKEISLYIWDLKLKTIDEFIFCYLYKQLSKITNTSLFEISYIKNLNGPLNLKQLFFSNNKLNYSI